MFLATFLRIFVVAGMHLLPEEVEKVEGAANFRQVFHHLVDLIRLIIDFKVRSAKLAEYFVVASGERLSCLWSWSTH